MKRRNTNDKSNYSIWRIFAYFIIYSILGFIVESIFCIVTKGVIESRQSFLYGPFCAIYGLGAVSMIVTVNKYKHSGIKLFIGGFIVGSFIEYFVSLVIDLLFHVKYWDYSNEPFDFYGRICLRFSFYWGMLAFFLIAFVNPRVDRFIEKIKLKYSINKLKMITTVVICFLLYDCVISGVAIYLFKVRKVHECNIEVSNKLEVEKQYELIYGNKKLSDIIYKLYGDKKMVRTYPNLKIEDKYGEIIFFNTLVPDVAPYYYKFK